MRRKIFWLLFFVLSAIVGHAQTPLQLIDSLKNELRKNPDNQKKVGIYSDLTWYYANVATDSALTYGNKALVLSKMLRQPKITGQVYSDIGSVYLAKGDMNQAKISYFKSLTIRTQLKDKDGIASNWSNIGGVYQRQHVLDTAMVYYLKALQFYESTKNEKYIDFVKNNIAVLYEDMHNFPKAIQMYKEVADYRRKTGQNLQLAMVYNNLGNVYKKMKAFPDSEKSFKESIVLSAKEGDSLILGNTYNNLGALYNYMKQPDKAIPVLEQGKRILEKVNSDFDLALIENSLATAYTNKKEFLKSKNLYLKSIETLIPLKANQYIGSMYLNLIPVYANLNMPDSASYYTEKYKEFQEREIENQVSLETAELETKYQTEKKERLLLLNQAEVRRKNVIVILLSVFALFIGLTGYLIFRQQKLKNRQLEQENELRLAISKIETQNKLQEQRLSISRDLHDNIGAQLTFIISSVDNIKYGFDVESSGLTSKLDRISNFTRATIVELRDTIWAMNSNEISFEDLRLRIMNFIEKAKKVQENIDFQFDIDKDLGTMKLTSIVGMNIYRTIQESVNNAIKYAEAGKIAIEIKSLSNQIAIAISDNGNGFDIANTPPGNGLANMKKRIKDIGGSFAIKSEPQKGTTINVNIDKNPQSNSNL
jgi:signal transduction histidine kinase